MSLFRISLCSSSGARRERNASKTTARELSTLFLRVTDFVRARRSESLAPGFIEPLQRRQVSDLGSSSTFINLSREQSVYD